MSTKLMWHQIELEKKGREIFNSEVRCKRKGKVDIMLKVHSSYEKKNVVSKRERKDEGKSGIN